MTVTTNLPSERVAALRDGIARHDAEAVGHILLQASSPVIDEIANEEFSASPGSSMSMEEYDRYVEQMDAELAEIFGPDSPHFSDYAISRAGIYGDHP